MSKLTKDKLSVKFYSNHCDIIAYPKAKDWIEFDNILLVNPTKEEAINVIKQTFNIHKIDELESAFYTYYNKELTQIYLSQLLREVYSTYRLKLAADKLEREKNKALLLQQAIDYVEYTYTIKIDKGESFVDCTLNKAYLVLKDYPNEVLFNLDTKVVEEVLYIDHSEEGRTYSKEELIKESKRRLDCIKEVEKLFKINELL